MDSQTKEMKLPLSLGKKLNGDYFMEDLTTLPHLLISGTTGYGKSNFIINLVDELAARKTPDEVKFLLIDSTGVEFMKLAGRVKYYLYQPVEARLGMAYSNIYDTYAAISELFIEMERRFNLLNINKCRSIDEYNSKYESKLPYIVLVVDEYADLLFCSSQCMGIADEDEEVESNDDDDASSKGNTFITDVSRLGMIAHLAGINVILSTARPSANIVTSAIKANYPARISFKVSHRQDSMVILDSTGAEKLQSPGDYIWSDKGIFEFVHSSLSKDMQCLINY